MMENEDLIEYPHRWCRVAHRARLCVAVASPLLIIVSAVTAGDVLMLGCLAAGIAVGTGYGWWRLRRVRRGRGLASAPAREMRDAALYSRKGWARLALMTDVAETVMCGAAGVLSAAMLWTGHEVGMSVVTVAYMGCWIALALALVWWGRWVHAQAVGWHYGVGSDGPPHGVSGAGAAVLVSGVYR